MGCLLLRSNHATFESYQKSKFLICKSRTLFESASCGRRFGRIISDLDCHSERSRGVPSQHDLAALRDALTALRSAQYDEQRRARYFLTNSAFSIMAMPPRSAILPFNVTVLPQYSAN